MSFEDRLHKAIERGKRRSDGHGAKQSHKRSAKKNSDACTRTYRLQISEHIEKCIRQLPNYFPGFRFETLYGERGWGVACSRDDLRLGGTGGARVTSVAWK